MNFLGQRDSVTTSGSAFAGAPANWDWDYDSLGQVSLADSPTAAYDRVFEYDAIGNRKKFAHGTTTLPVSDNYSANALNQYSQVPNYTPQPVHDADGNLNRGPVPGSNGRFPGVQPPADATQIEWDAENRMASCQIGGTIYRYEYDHLSRLITRLVNNTVNRRYNYDSWNRIAEYSNTALLDIFTWGLDLSGTLQSSGGVGGLLATRWSGSGDYFPTYDGNGNVSEYLTTSGLQAVHFEYDPFGTLTRLSGNTNPRFQYRFSTKPRDINTGLYYYLYRYYDPETGRWPSSDPIEERGGVNLYGFVGNDGVNRFDYLGLKTKITVEDCEVKIVAGHGDRPRNTYWEMKGCSIGGFTGCFPRTNNPPGRAYQAHDAPVGHDHVMSIGQGDQNMADTKHFEANLGADPDYDRGTGETPNKPKPAMEGGIPEALDNMTDPESIQKNVEKLCKCSCTNVKVSIELSKEDNQGEILEGINNRSKRWNKWDGKPQSKSFSCSSSGPYNFP